MRITSDARAIVRASLVWAARWAFLGVLGAIAVTAARSAESGAARPEPPGASVRMTEQMRFEPAHVRVRVGQEVLWQNVSTLTHSVTDDPSEASDPANAMLPQGAQAFHSGAIDPGGSWRRRFTVPGHYRYFCLPHEARGMVGEVEVVK